MDEGLLPLTMMDAAIVAQTVPGRPMLTHHVLELGAPLSRPALERAVEALAAVNPALRARPEEHFFRWSLKADPIDPARARAALTVADAPAWLEDTDWVERPFDIAREWPFRVRYGPTPGGTYSLCFTLHHRVTDGSGALMLFDALLTELEQPVAVHPERRPQAVVEGSARPFRTILRQGPVFLLRLLAQTARSVGHFWQHRAVLLDAPRAPIEGFNVRVLKLSPEAWAALKERAVEQGFTRNDLLCAAALEAAGEIARRGGDASRALRMLTPIDLRGFFGAHAPVSNWMGTIEIDVTPAELASPKFTALLQKRLAAGKSPLRALATPVLLGLLGAVLPAAAFRFMFQRVHAPATSNPFSLLVSHIRPPEDSCWPEALQPVSLWCASTLPRKPGLGLTITTAGDAVTIAACWPRPLVKPETIDALLQALRERLEPTRVSGLGSRVSV